MRIQKRIKGQIRESLAPCVLKENKDAIENDSLIFGVSKSFVISVILANAYGIKKQEDFLEPVSKKEKKRGGK